MLNTKKMISAIKIISAIKLDKELLSPEEQEEAAIIICHALRTYRDSEPCATGTGYYFKPPLGVMPKPLLDVIDATRRLHDLRRALAQYIAEHQTISLEWVQEYNDLTARLIGEPCYEIKDNG